MRRDEINYFLVGLSTLGALTLLLVLLYRVTGQVGDTDTYHVWYDEVTGIGPGSLVTYEGYRVGYVDRIEPHQDRGTRYRVVLRIRSGWKIPRDSRARIVASGLLSDTVIDIREGHARETIPAGGEIPGEQAPDVFAVVNDLGGELADLARHQVRPLVAHLDHLVGNLDQAMDRRLPRLLDSLESVMQRLDASAATLQHLLDAETERRVDHILVNADALSGRLLDVADGLRETRAQVDRLVRLASTLLEANDADIRDTVIHVDRTTRTLSTSLETILLHLEDASRNLEEFSRELRADPSALIHTRARGREVSP
ncbi:MAG: MCE family protein [Gammaproteobacteria bacterium]|nr:MAG: MCE family protein [Gammaproteobacteria bacterium]